ncbi:MAG: glycosyltransferase [Bacteroidaceae bacterium]|nr:glycosyltransferase [Bacteroidaceae bacterium]
MKICVITVTYNAESTVERTLRSVASQALRDEVGIYSAEYSQGRRYEVEHWVLDGASGDGTVRIVKGYGHVMWKSERDNGIYDAMNKGLATASGDYLVFLNAGDALHDTHTLQHVFDTAEEWLVKDGALPAVIYGQTEWVDEDERFIDMRNHWAPERLTSRSFLTGMLVCHQAFYARIDLAKRERYDLRWRLSADYDWCIRVMRLAERMGLRMANTRYILASYLAEGMTTRHHAKSLRERLHIMARHYGWVPALWQHFLKVLGL